jgi:signal transduction histidine kinase
MPTQFRIAERGDRAGLWRAVIGAGLLLVAIVAGIPLQTRDDSLIQSVGLFEDATATLDIDDMQDRTFRPVPASVPIGFVRANHWLRILVAPDPAGGEVLLRLRPMTLDRAVLYLPDGRGGWHTATTGEKVAAEARSWPSMLRHLLRLGVLEKPTVAYVLVDSQSPSSLFVSAFPAQTSTLVDVRTFMFHAFIFGLKGVSVMMILLTLPRRQNAVNALFLSLELAFFAYLMFHLGYVQSVFHDLPPALLDLGSAVAVTGLILIATLFHRALLGQFSPAPLARLLSLLPVALAGAGLFTILAGARLPGLALASAGYALVIPTCLFMLVTMRTDAPPGLRRVRLTYAAYLPFLALNLLTTTGAVEVEWFYRSGPEFSAIASSTLILSLVLAMNRALNMQWEERRQAIRRSVVTRRADSRLRRSQHALTHLVASQTQDAIRRLHAILARRPEDGATGPVRRAMVSLQDVVADCLQAEEAETGVWRTAARPFDAALVLRDLVAELPAGVPVTADAPPALGIVSDEGLFAIILRHVLLNAAAYRKEGGVVTLRLRAAERDGIAGLSLTVTNPVAGTTAIDTERMFEKFYRGPAASPTSGTGLGLFICRGIATALGGSIGASAGDGAVAIHLWLPDRT